MFKSFIALSTCLVFSIDAHLIKGKVDTRGQAIELHNTHVEVNMDSTLQLLIMQDSFR